jgi:type IV secretion system protein VirD4
MGLKAPRAGRPSIGRRQDAELARANDGLHAGVDPQGREDLGQVPFDGPSRQADDRSDVAWEIAFAPKELKVAQDLSERLGAYTYKARSQSAPTLLSKGNRSISQSDQRRLLNLPQELIQMPPDQLIVLRAGLPPIRGRKIAYYRERAFTRRVLPPPQVPARPIPAADAPAATPPAQAPAPDPFALTLDLALPALEAEGLPALPPHGATPEEVEAWVDRFIDRSAQPPEVSPHGR